MHTDAFQAVYQAEVSQIATGGIPERQEVMFDDGHAVWLDRVHAYGLAQMFQRRVAGDLPRTVDLRDLVPDLGPDLLNCPRRDVAFMVHMSLRLKFKTLEAFNDAVAAAPRR